MKNRISDPLTIVEAAYRIDGSDSDWLAGIATASLPALDEGFGLCVFEFHYRLGERFRLLQSTLLGVPEDLAKLHRTIFDSMDPDVQTRPFRHGPCTTGSQMMGLREEFKDNELMKRYAQKFGMYDSIWITAAEPTGYGCGLHAGRPRIGWASRATTRYWGRIAAHLSAAARLRRRLGLLADTQSPGSDDQGPSRGQVEAILTPNGRLEHAEGPAKDADCITRLREAVVAVERARTRSARADGSGLDAWPGLVEGRWSLLEMFEKDGRRYVVARENEPTPPGPAALTLRERQVLGYASLGHENKVIAYELGIAHNTVKVLMARAAAKLGARSRVDLIARYRAMCEAPRDPQPSNPKDRAQEGEPNNA